MRNRLSDEQGFTLIELLVVILIIGILAAIALPNFLGQRTKAQDASAKSMARTAVSQVESCFTDNQTYIGCTDATGLGANTGIDFSKVVITAPAALQYTVKATSQSLNSFSISKNATGLTVRDCVIASGNDKGGCTGTGNTW